jgi:DNA-binding HxlR family transcriptional regulator
MAQETRFDIFDQRSVPLDPGRPFKRLNRQSRLQLIERRWALSILIELSRGPRRFSGLRAALPQLSPNILTDRLRELMDADLIKRELLPAPAKFAVYRVVPGQAPPAALLEALAKWAGR